MQCNVFLVTITSCIAMLPSIHCQIYCPQPIQTKFFYDLLQALYVVSN